MTNNKVVKWIGRIFAIGACLFIARSILKMDVDFKQMLTGWNLFLILASAGIMGGLQYLSAIVWCLVLRFVADRAIRFLPICKVYLSANIAKYLPGNVMHYVGRNALGVQMGLTQVQMATASIIEVGTTCVICLLLSVLLAGRQFFNILAQYLQVLNHWIILGIIMAAILIIIGLFILYNRKRHLFSSIHLRCDWHMLFLFIKMFVAYAFLQCIQGLMLVFFLQDAVAWSTSSILLVVASYSVAWFVGFIVPGAPGGIGVREAVLTLMLQSLCGVEAVIFAALMMRIAAIFGDILSYLSTIIIPKETGENPVQ